MARFLLSQKLAKVLYGTLFNYEVKTLRASHILLAVHGDASEEKHSLENRAT